jgi:cytochrome c
METQMQKRSWRFLQRFSAEGFLAIVLGVFALGITLIPFPSSALSPVQDSSEAGDAKRGEKVFGKRCTGCHSLDRDKEGPRLRGVYGAKAASLSSTFMYSETLKASNVTWDARSLDQWMAEPEKIVPNSDMFFRLPRADERADVIAYLKTLAQ